MFVRRYGEELSGAAKVTVPSGHAWQIGLTKDQSNIWFDEGWQKFVEHHSISYGYLLLFAYRGCCNFSVLIFDMSACEIPYPCVGSTSAKNTNYGEKHFFNHVENMEDEDSIEISGCKTASPDSCVLKSRDLNGFGSEGKSSKRHNASAEQNLGMKRRRGCNSVQKSQDLKQCGDKKSEEFVKEVDAEIIDLENGRESRNYRRMYRTRRSSLNESNNKVIPLNADKNKSTSKSEDVRIVAGIPARAFTERSRVLRSAKKLEPESPFKVTLDLKQFGDKRSEEFVKEVDAEIIHLEENGRESRKEKLNYRRMYRTRQSSLNESNNKVIPLNADKNKSPSKSEDLRIVAGIPARAFTERSRVLRSAKKLEPESPFKVTLDLKQFGDKRSEQFVKEVDAEIIDLEENGRESRKEKLNYRRMYRTRQSSLNESNNKDKNKSPSKSEDLRIVAGIPARAFTERSRVLRSAKKLEPESPSFKVTLQPYNIHKHLLYVPHGFARRHLVGCPAIIKLEVSNGRYWPVQILQHEHQLVTLTKGWSQFVGENDLVEGDVCTFELVKGNGCALKVTVSRDACGVSPCNLACPPSILSLPYPSALIIFHTKVSISFLSNHISQHLWLGRHHKKQGIVSMATASATFSPAALVAAAVGSPRRKRANVNFIAGLNSFGGLKAHSSVSSLGMSEGTEQSFAKIVSSFRAPAKGKGRSGGALSSTCSDVGEIFRIAAIMNGLVLVGVAVGFVLLRVEAFVEETE
ncbi:B3 DOMAIN-CONTAINING TRANSCRIPTION FACTOR VRN1-LIKE [Salix viminalis]|nr:B3 DOMAIN-CONTAINING TRANSCRIPTION FACTOR VRN1-LIKE [Salix viminalis]